MKFDLHKVPYSYYGSYLAFSYPLHETKEFADALTLRIIHGEFDRQESYYLLMHDAAGNAQPYETTARPWELRLENKEKEINVCFLDEETVHISGNTGLGIKKEVIGSFDRVICHTEKQWELAGGQSSLMAVINHGTVRDTSIWSEAGKGSSNICFQIFPDSHGRLDVTLQRFDITYHPSKIQTYEQSKQKNKTSYETYIKRWWQSEDYYRQTTELAVYTIWSAVVKPEGYVQYPAVLMSKNIMNFIWSWDYTFNALALWGHDESLAFAQFDDMIARQDADGAFPDCFNARKEVRSFVKPPVQGFILQKMMEKKEISMSRLEILYESEKRHTNWWLDNRLGEDGIPLYFHGNDSGWDNGTVFSEGVPVQSPDSCTWLIFQLEFLEKAAEIIGRDREAGQWKAAKQQMKQVLFEKLVTNGHFVARKYRDGKAVGKDSLLIYVPLLLGNELPEDVRVNMLKELVRDNRFLTQFGPVSEALSSTFFQEDGYWRGAVWPPMVYIVCEILKRNNEWERAAVTARAYCDMCRKSGFAENYSGLTGAAQCDGAYTWAASVYLLLYEEYVSESWEKDESYKQQ